MNSELIEKKLSAFLHDPIDKPFILMIESHSGRAKSLSNLLGISVSEDDATGADWISSAMDRLLIPKIGRNDPNFQVKFAESPKILHPLSCEVLDLEQVPDKETIKDVVEKCMKKIASLNLNKEQLYLYLWHNLKQHLKDNSDPSWSKLWDIIPADTRVPDHTIWDHIKITCACSASSFADKSNVYNQLSTFIFSIGPVQKFIQTARKTQDLWMGSYILSYLIWIAIRTVIEDFGPDCIIYPDLHGQPFVAQWLKEKGIDISDKVDLKLPTLPNRFLAILPKDDVLNTGKKAENAVREEFANIAKEVFNKIFEGFHQENSYAAEMLNCQISNFLEIYWIGLPWFSSDNGKSDWEIAIEKLNSFFSTEKISQYKEFLNSLKDKGEYQPNIGTLYGLLHEMAERSLGSVKNIRTFEQTEECGRKCSLCGERDIIRFEKDLSIKKSMQRWHELSQKFAKYFDENEALCSVCLVKRAGDLYFKKKLDLTDISFPSTSEVSSASFKKLISENDELKKIYDLFVQNMLQNMRSMGRIDSLPSIKSLKNNIDGEWLFPENLRTNENITKDSQNILKILIEKAGLTPSKYYAIITMDGNNMGKWLSGDLLPEIANTLHPKIRDNVYKAYEGLLDGRRMIKPSIHAFISSALKDFSLKIVTEIVENRHLGKLVYAGGDDVLALVNLTNLLDVMIELRCAFSGHIDKNFKVDFEKTSCSGFIETDDGYYLTMGSKATASMGVAIAHYKMPLREALNWSREMEKEAKMLNGKDAFAIALMKHSGEIRKVVSKWTYENGKLNTITLMKKLTDKLNKGLSDKFIYNLRKEFSRLIDESSRFESLGSIFDIELKRLMIRAKGKRISKEEINELSDYMLCFLPYMSFGNFISLLEIANAITNEVRS